MAPSIHPPCTPSASCTPIRCHPTPPPCQNPERCLRKTTSKGIRPCRSAASILATRSKAKCASCGKTTNARSVSNVEKFLKRKSQEGKLQRKDRLTGSHKYLDYTRKEKGKVRSQTSCCAGKGHRGRLKKKKCTIL